MSPPPRLRRPGADLLPARLGGRHRLPVRNELLGGLPLLDTGGAASLVHPVRDLPAVTGGMPGDLPVPQPPPAPRHAGLPSAVNASKQTASRVSSHPARTGDEQSALQYLINQYPRPTCPTNLLTTTTRIPSMTLRFVVAPLRASIVKFSFPGAVPPIQHRSSETGSIVVPPCTVNMIVFLDRVTVTTTVFGLIRHLHPRDHHSRNPRKDGHDRSIRSTLTPPE